MTLTPSDVVTISNDQGVDQTIAYHYLPYGVTAHSPLLVFIHEGLGSVALWKKFPEQLCQRLAVHGLLYSRPGYGDSPVAQLDDIWPPTFMHAQALSVLPAFLHAVGLWQGARQPLWLVGHSDGASIALIYGAHYAEQLAGLVVLAPHVLVESVCLRRIAEAQQQFATTDFKQRFVRNHRQGEALFWTWSNTWLSSAFASWSLLAELPAIRCPVLAIQGRQDPYGTLQQLELIAQQVAHTKRVVVEDCAHSPHLEQATQVLAHITAFIRPQLAAHQ